MSRIVVAMSGGVDSSVAAALVQRAGHEAVGVTMKLLPRLDSSFGCCGSPRDIDDAKRVCETLGVPHYVVDMAELFESKVIAPFVKEYLGRRTPNPCVECNRSVKFGYLLALAEAWKASHVATGHYARVAQGRLYRSVDAEKDQTYFLHSLTRKELDRVLFPVGGLEKREVRRIAAELELKTADKPESMEICFVPGGDYRSLVRSRAGGEAVGVGGPIRDASGLQLGSHAGLENYTIGQRRGLGVSAADPLYVTGMDAAENALVVGPDRETRRSSLTASGVTWTGEAPSEPISALARIRHRHVPAAAVIRPLEGGRVWVDFAEAQRAITPGQAVVFYREDEVLGGGTIEEAL
ncbi:MAG: tRNA 2-thiouridine(34) synthase MnmA [Elusimicrobia bacterium]|nr:tRNA 2-thiouridine(34) synthase MnmA [Elusimicrobiota bacterium]